MKLSDLKIKLFADGANLSQIAKLAADDRIAGFTTNPSLLRNAGVKDYATFAKEAINIVAPRPISFEIIADDHDEMYRQANIIAGWGENAVVKIPEMDTQGNTTIETVRKLVLSGIPINVTAVFSQKQIDRVLQVPVKNISIFCGRIADCGTDPSNLVWRARKAIGQGNTEIIWASPREVLNILHAYHAGAHIITATPAILEKLSSWGKDLDAYSLETIAQFYSDAVQSKFVL